MQKSVIFMMLAITFIFQSCFLDPCYSKKSFLSHLEKTVEDVKENSDGYSQQDWEKKDHELEKLMDECYEKYKNDLSREERKLVFNKSVQYVYERQRDKFGDLFSVLEDMEIDKEAQRLIEMTDDQIKTIFNDVLKDDLESFLDDAVNEIEKLAKDLKEAWEDAKRENQ